jgi:uncharacterized membrane protein (DUF373 family)
MFNILLIIILINLIFLFLIFFSRISFTLKINITVISLFFPIHIQFLGRDAITTGTILIFLLFIYYIFNSYKEGVFIYDKVDLLIYMLILFVGFSTFFNYYHGSITKELIGIAIRRYIFFIGGMLLFLMIKNIRIINIKISDQKKVIERLFSIFLILIAVHILITIAIQFIPQFDPLFKIFSSRDLETLMINSFGKNDIISRMNSFVFGQESFGEIIGSLVPIVVYKLYKKRQPIWIIIYIIFATGVLLSATRSGIIFFILGTSFTILFFIGSKFYKTFIFACILIISILCVFYIQPFFLENIITRFEVSVNAFTMTGNLFETTNRSFLPEVFSYVNSNLSLIGHGILKPKILWMGIDLQFHNFYLTTIHQFGVIGSLIFFIIILLPIYSLIHSFLIYKSATNKHLVFASILSITFFLLNELKFEFTRHSSYLQIWLALLATFNLLGNYNNYHKEANS